MRRVLKTVGGAAAFVLVLGGAVLTAGPAFAADDFTYSHSGTAATVTGYSGPADVVIPSTVDISGTTYDVTAIGAAAFSSKNITSVTIPDSVTQIGPLAFSGNQLTSVSIPHSVTSVGSGAFSSNQLTSLVIPDSVTAVGFEAFKNNQLTSVVIPAGLTAIPSNVFEENNLTSVVIPVGATSIGNNAFASNESLASVTIPNSMKFINDFAFLNDTSLTSVTIPASVMNITKGAFNSGSSTFTALFEGAPPPFIAVDEDGSFGPAAGRILYYYPVFASAMGTGGGYEIRAIEFGESSLVVSSAGPVAADGTATQTATVTVRDEDHDPVAGATVVFTAPDMTMSTSSCVSGADGTCSIAVTSTVGGTHSLSALIGASTAPLLADVEFAASASASDSLFTVSGGNVVADGVATQNAKVIVQDVDGNPVSGATVDFAVAGAATLSAPSAVSDTDGAASVKVTSLAAGAYNVTAAIGGAQVGTAQAAVFVAGPVSVAQSSWVVTSTGPVTADGVAGYTATVTAEDANGNPVAGVVVDFSVPTGVTASAATCTTISDGTCSIILTSTLAGSYSGISASIASDQVGATQGTVFVAGPVDPAVSTVTSSESSITADGDDSSKITVTARDANGNPLTSSAGMVTVTSTLGVVSSVVDNGDGTYTATLTSTTVGTATVSFTINSVTAAKTATVTVTAAEDTTPTGTTPTGTTPTGTTPAADDDDLAFTGADAVLPLSLGGVFLALGLGLVLIMRRRVSRSGRVS